jgi:hypothetical protein
VDLDNAEVKLIRKNSVRWNRFSKYI